MTDFERQLAVEVAAQDDNVVAFHQLRILGYSTTVSTDRSLALEDYTQKALDVQTMDVYKINEEQMSQATALCIGSIVTEKSRKSIWA